MATLPGGWPWVVSVLLLFFASAVHRRKKYARYPPGPTPLPLVGNILDFPRTHLGREFAAMSKKFGDVVYLNVLGQRFVIIGSLKAARDLLDKRSANYSDRPPSVMVQLVGYEWITVFMNYGPRWREHRRAFHATMAASIVPQYQGIQLDVARNFLRILLRSPQGLTSHVKFTITAVFIGAVYGIELCELQDQYYQTVERVAEVAEALVIPGNFPVEAFPMLRYLPSWFPGGGFKAWAANAKEDILHTVDDLFHGAKDRMMRNPSKRSVISCMLEDSALHGEQVAELEKVCKDAAATLYFAAADTSTATMAAFFVAMVLYPDVQKRAQQELDAVVGTERLPEFSDRPSLPYLNALVKELLRWHPVTPIGAPHRVVADDEYDGHLIPSGASVFVNIWAILHDQKVYPKPNDFVPERFLDSAGNLDVQGRDPADVMFGFGRRVCPGRYLAEATLFILCASVLATFNIGPPVGEDGAPREVALEAMDHWILSRPKIHNYSIKPRQANVELLVEGTSEAHHNVV